MESLSKLMGMKSSHEHKTSGKYEAVIVVVRGKKDRGLSGKSRPLYAPLHFCGYRNRAR